jgi:hypothetical protein
MAAAVTRRNNATKMRIGPAATTPASAPTRTPSFRLPPSRYPAIAPPSAGENRRNPSTNAATSLISALTSVSPSPVSPGSTVRPDKGTQRPTGWCRRTHQVLEPCC